MEFAPIAFGLDPLSIVTIVSMVAVLWTKMGKNWGF
jgi:hypothetical protein